MTGLLVLRPDGTEIRRVPVVAGDCSIAMFSPDGRSVLFTSREDCTEQAVLRLDDRSSPRPIELPPTTRIPDWQRVAPGG